MVLACSPVVAHDRLHALYQSKYNGDEEEYHAVDNAVGTYGHIASVVQQTAVDHQHHQAGTGVHQERTHAYHEDVLEYVEFRSPGMATESDEGLPVNEMQDGDNR